MNVNELNERFGIPGVAEFDRGEGGLTMLAITAPGGEAEVYLHGGNVTHFKPADGQPCLWVSKSSRFDPDSPTRGGVPVCFPWFGSAGPTPESPFHGFARLMDWDVESIDRTDAGVAVTLILRSDEQTLQFWPGQFELRITVTVATTLTMALEARNVGHEAFTITEALHTYFHVSDVRNVKILGLENAEYTAFDEHKRQGDEPITFAAETDRGYTNTTASCVLDDPGMARRITVEKSGSDSTVVWNPWIGRAADIPDFGDDEWPGMVCIETANLPGNAVTIPPGGSHVMEARISAERTDR
jgi:D-hexose-6-phosphate mutarotase